MIRYATLFIVTIMIFIMFNLMIYQNQKLLRSGETIYFSIVPSNPLPVMQGYRMPFRYKIEDEIKKSHLTSTQNHGYIVIAYDDNSVGQFVRFYDGEKLSPNEKVIKYRRSANKNANYRIVPNNFFFHEKLKNDIKNAEYAIFHYQGEKDYLLVGLGDGDKKRINEK